MSDELRRVGEDGFPRVVAGVDGSPEGVEAARQGAMLAAPDAAVRLVSAYTLATSTTGVSGVGIPVAVDEDAVRAAAEEAVEAAAAALPERHVADRIVAAGAAWELLAAEAEGEPGTLLAVGSHGVGRLAGILVGSVATEVVHRVRATVLVARAAADAFPRKVVVGVDGSPGSAAAHALAQGIAARFGATLWPAVAHGGKGVDMAAARAIVGDRFDDLSGDPADGLVAAAADADLLVVGSRGLHGFRALGSVSERVAHEARCSVLVVRSAG